MKKILIDAFKSSELEYHLTEIIAVDDKCEVNDIPDATIMKEAVYVLGKYTGASVGFEQEDDLKGRNGPEQQAEARKEVRALKRFLDKYDEQGAIKPVVKPPPMAEGQLRVFRGSTYQLVKPAGPRRGWIVKRLTDNKEFRLNCRQLSASSVAVAASGNASPSQ